MGLADTDDLKIIFQGWNNETLRFDIARITKYGVAILIELFHLPFSRNFRMVDNFPKRVIPIVARWGQLNGGRNM
jgi:hypothetical protein